jgi:hypothetical protein
MPRRFDTWEITGVEKTPQGGLRIPARPTRAGILIYRNADGSERRELRRPEQVFAENSLRSLRGAPVTDLHPLEPVSPANYKALSVGHVTDNITRDGLLVSAPVIVQDAAEIDLINSGERKELSCGYSCDINPTPGIWEGQPYDVEQINIVYNHVGIGPSGWGRAGSSVCLRLDSGDAICLIDKTVSLPPKDPPMPGKIKVDGIEYEIGSDAHLQAVQKVLDNQAAALAKIGSEKAASDARADAAEKAAKDAAEALAKAQDPKALAEKIARRADMLDQGRRVAKIRGVRFDLAETASESETLLAILKMIDPKFSAEGKDPKFIEGYALARIATLLAQGNGSQTIETDKEEEEEDPEEKSNPPGNGAPPDMPPGRSDSIYDARRRASQETGKAPSRHRGDGSEQDTPEAAERRMRNDSRSAWQSPLTFSKDAPK